MSDQLCGPHGLGHGPKGTFVNGRPWLEPGPATQEIRGLISAPGKPLTGASMPSLNATLVDPPSLMAMLGARPSDDPRRTLAVLDDYLRRGLPEGLDKMVIIWGAGADPWPRVTDDQLLSIVDMLGIDLLIPALSAVADNVVASLLELRDWVFPFTNGALTRPGQDPTALLITPKQHRIYMEDQHWDWLPFGNPDFAEGLKKVWDNLVRIALPYHPARNRASGDGTVELGLALDLVNKVLGATLAEVAGKIRDLLGGASLNDLATRQGAEVSTFDGRRDVLSEMDDIASTVPAQAESSALPAASHLVLGAGTSTFVGLHTPLGPTFVDVATGRAAGLPAGAALRGFRVPKEIGAEPVQQPRPTTVVEHRPAPPVRSSATVLRPVAGVETITYANGYSVHLIGPAPVRPQPAVEVVKQAVEKGIGASVVVMRSDGHGARRRQAAAGLRSTSTDVRQAGAILGQYKAQGAPVLVFTHRTLEEVLTGADPTTLGQQVRQLGVPVVARTFRTPPGTPAAALLTGHFVLRGAADADENVLGDRMDLDAWGRVAGLLPKTDEDAAQFGPAVGQFLVQQPQALRHFSAEHGAVLREPAVRSALESVNQAVYWPLAQQVDRLDTVGPEQFAGLAEVVEFPRRLGLLDLERMPAAREAAYEYLEAADDQARLDIVAQKLAPVVPGNVLANFLAGDGAALALATPLATLFTGEGSLAERIEQAKNQIWRFKYFWERADQDKVQENLSKLQQAMTGDSADEYRGGLQDLKHTVVECVTA